MPMAIFKTRTTIYDILKRDHDEIEQLLDRISSSTDASEQAWVFADMKAKLDAHNEAEEQVFYSRLQKDPLTKESVLEAVEEQALIKRLLNELETETIDDSWRAKLAVLKTNVEHHVWEEERMLFARAKAVIDADEAERIGNTFILTKEDLMVAPVGVE